VIARLRRTPTSLIEASMDLGADGWQTFRYVTFPAIRTAVVASTNTFNSGGAIVLTGDLTLGWAGAANTVTFDASANGGTLAVGGQIERWTFPAKLSPPVLLLSVEAPCVQLLVLPGGKVRVLNAQFRQFGFCPATPCLIASLELLPQNIERPVVVDHVVKTKNEPVFGRTQSQQQSPQEWRSAEIEWSPYFT